MHLHSFEIKLRRGSETEVYKMTGDWMDSSEQLRIFELDEEGESRQIGVFMNWEYCVQLPKEKDPET